MQLVGLEEVASRLRNAGPIVRNTRKGLHQSGLAVQREAAQLVPGDTGRLRSSIRVEVDRSSNPTWAKVGPNVFYGPYVEFGTGIYGPRRRPIVPVRRRFLSWVDRRTGRRIFARSVRGSRPRPYMKPGLERAKSRIRRIWRDVSREIAGYITGG